VCIFSYWIYVAPGCIIVHLTLTTVGVCVDPVGVGQVYAGGGVDENVHRMTADWLNSELKKRGY
jgi:hypothetical protein